MARFGTLALLILAHFSGVAQMAFHAKWPTLAELADGADCFVEAVGEEELSAFEAYTEANRLIIEENWSEAEAILATMMVQAPDNRNFAYKRALCLRAIKGRIAEAVPLAMLAIQGEFEKRYNPFDVTMALPPDLALDLALEVLQFTGHFAQAQGVAKTMMDRYPERDDLHQKAKRAMASAAAGEGEDDNAAPQRRRSSRSQFRADDSAAPAAEAEAAAEPTAAEPTTGG